MATTHRTCSFCFLITTRQQPATARPMTRTCHKANRGHAWPASECRPASRSPGQRDGIVALPAWATEGMPRRSLPDCFSHAPHPLLEPESGQSRPPSRRDGGWLASPAEPNAPAPAPLGLRYAPSYSAGSPAWRVGEKDGIRRDRTGNPGPEHTPYVSALSAPRVQPRPSWPAAALHLPRPLLLADRKRKASAARIDRRRRNTAHDAARPLAGAPA